VFAKQVFTSLHLTQNLGNYMRYVTCEVSLNKPDRQPALHLELPEMNAALGSSAEASSAIQQSTSTSIQENACSFYHNPAHSV